MFGARRYTGLAAILLLPLLLAGCMGGQEGSSFFSSGASQGRAILRHASAGPLGYDSARLILDNDEAFHSKLTMVREARSTINAMYFIFSNDHSSSMLSEALIAAARRGVKVRLLLDYNSTYMHLDTLSMLEREGNTGKGSLEIRLYGRPTRHMVMDAAYVSLGCGEHDTSQCGSWKLSEIEKSFRQERIDGRSASGLKISNLNIAGSGMFLSGFYTKDFDLMSFAVLKGSKINTGKAGAHKDKLTPENIRKFGKLGKLFWQSRTGGPLQRISARFKLAFVSLFYGKVVNPVYEAISAYLPLSRRGFGKAARDWEHSWNFLHHKFLLVDESQLQVGGRNVENAYHMKPNGLLHNKLMFQDSDLHVSLTSGGDEVREAFDALWQFRTLVASLDEIRAHAPNDFTTNKAAFSASVRACRGAARSAKWNCVSRAFNRRAMTLEKRITRAHKKMKRNAAIYRSRYRPLSAARKKPSFEVDPGAVLAYVENLPFRKSLFSSPGRRRFSAKTGREAASGKHANALLLERMANVCRVAGPGNEKRIIINNGYYFLPANMLRRLAQILSGELDCRHVRVTVVTNSITTSDVNIVINFGRRSLAALFDHLKEHRIAERAAKFEYYEYRTARGRYKLPLHSKVWVIGDDLFVGSLNADIRSLIMDSNNGVYIGGAPKLSKAYTQYIDRLTHQSGKLRQVTEAISAAESKRYERQDLSSFRIFQRQNHIERHLPRSRRADIEKKLLKLLARVYELSREIMKPGKRDKKASDAFNRLYGQI